MTWKPGIQTRNPIDSCILHLQSIDTNVVLYIYTYVYIYIHWYIAFISMYTHAHTYVCSVCRKIWDLHSFREASCSLQSSFSTACLGLKHFAGMSWIPFRFKKKEVSQLLTMTRLNFYIQKKRVFIHLGRTHDFCLLQEVSFQTEARERIQTSMTEGFALSRLAPGNRKAPWHSFLGDTKGLRFKV